MCVLPVGLTPPPPSPSLFLSHTRTAENRIPIVEEGVLKPLITYVNNEDNDMIGRQYCAMAIGNLASEREFSSARPR